MHKERVQFDGFRKETGRYCGTHKKGAGQMTGPESAFLSGQLPSSGLLMKNITVGQLLPSAKSVRLLLIGRYRSGMEYVGGAKG